MDETNKNNEFYVMIFESANHCIQTEKQAGRLFNMNTAVIPTPVELTSECGLALKFPAEELNTIKEFHKTLTIPADVYFICSTKDNGKRKTEKIL